MRLHSGLYFNIFLNSILQEKTVKRTLFPVFPVRKSSFQGLLFLLYKNSSNYTKPWSQDIGKKTSQPLDICTKCK